MTFLKIGAARTSAAHLKLLLNKRQIPFRNFKWKSGTRFNMFASAHDFPKFVWVPRWRTNFGKWALDGPRH